VSEGTLATFLSRTATHVQGVEARIKTALSQAPVIHQDETGREVKKRRMWMHGTSTHTLTHDQARESRGKKAWEANGSLAEFRGVSVHDCWASFFRYGCQHALCLAHLLRELTFVAEALGRWWAARLKRLLQEMKHATDQAREQGQAALWPPEVAHITTRCLLLLSEGDQVHPRVTTPTGTGGKAKQHPGRNLLDRLHKYQVAVPFDNTVAEQDIRTVNVQQNVSGSFRSTEGAVACCRIRGSLSTLRKQGLPMFSALQATLTAQPLLPSFSAS
jgi:transposase